MEYNANQHQATHQTNRRIPFLSIQPANLNASDCKAP